MAIDCFYMCNGSKRIIILICIFVAATTWSGCHRKVGVKPGGQLKTDTSKCKCKKKKGGIYAHYSALRTSFNK